MRGADSGGYSTQIFYPNVYANVAILGFVGGYARFQRVPISPPLLNTTKPLKWLNISGAFSLLGFGLGQI